MRLLSIFLSLWIAGGCLFSCTGTATGAESKHEAQPVSSCHAKHAKQTTGAPSFVPGPRGELKDCPLVVNATAATSKNSGHLPDPGRSAVSTTPLIARTTVQSNTSLDVAYLPNRGHTHLRCCVFLI